MNKEIFYNKKADFEKLIQYGFTIQKGIYKFKQKFLNDEFWLSIEIKQNGEINTNVTEVATSEPYTLHLIPDADGAFVGKLREEYEKILNDIAQNCFDTSIFKSEYTHKLIEYAKNKYNDNPEYLWEKFPNNAILRRKDTKKWYGAILTVSKKKLGFDTDENVEVIDLRAKDSETFIDNKKYFPGYHMNKKHWITIILDGSVDMQEIYKRLDLSYDLALK